MMGHLYDTLCGGNHLTWLFYEQRFVHATENSKSSRTSITIQYSLCPARRFSVGYVVLARAARDPIISAVRKGVDCLSLVIRSSISTQVERGCLLSIIARVDPAKTTPSPPTISSQYIHTSSNPQHTNTVSPPGSEDSINCVSGGQVYNSVLYEFLLRQ